MFGSGELILIFLIALIVFGPRKLPELAQALGRAINEFKKASSELQHRLEEEITAEQTKPPTPAAMPTAPRAETPGQPSDGSPHEHAS
jgi:sec-independent protein translocase protein TatA